MKINFTDSPWIDIQYINLLARDIEKFRWVKSNNLANCRCFICGDSKTNKNKTRGYFMGDSKGWRYYCHNCQASFSLQNILKIYFEGLYGEYIKDKLTETKRETSDIIQNFPAPAVKPFVAKPMIIDDDMELIRCDRLPHNHPAFQFLKFRDIPFSWFSRIYYTNNFSRLVAEDLEILEDRRVFMTLKNIDREVVGFIGRGIVKGQYRYRNAFVKEDPTAFYNIEYIKPEQRVYVFEGPFDSMFLNNSIAVCNSRLTRYHEKLFAHQDSVLVYDNEPRNKELLSQIGNAIAQQRKVCIWNEKFSKKKDINQMVESGIKPEAIKEFIDNNTFSGLEAQWKFARQFAKI